MPFNCNCNCLSVSSESTSNYYTIYSHIGKWIRFIVADFFYINTKVLLITDNSKKSSSSTAQSSDRVADSSFSPATTRKESEVIIRNAEEDNSINMWLKQYPWFHGTLSRNAAAELVLKDGGLGHGLFLVRQSTSRRGQHVLTFNFQARATHIPLQIRRDGVCKVKHMNFNTIFDMLEHFRLHDIPCDSYRDAEMTLTHFVNCLDVNGRN